MMDGHYIDELIAENLRRLLSEKDISQNKLGEMIDVPPPLINNIIQKRKGLGKELMARICHALKIEPYELYLTADAPVIVDPVEKKYLYKMREAEILKVDEEIMHYADYRVRQERNKDDKLTPDDIKLLKKISRHNLKRKAG